MPTISNIQDLEIALHPYIIKALELTRDEIATTIQRHVEEYYKEDFFVDNEPKNKPYFYKRTEEFKDALPNNVYPVTYSDGKFSFKVGFPEDYLNFQYDGGATGFQVLGWASEGAHGGIYGNNTHRFLGENVNLRYGDGNVFFWNDALVELESKYESIQNLFKSNCKKVGLPIN